MKTSTTKKYKIGIAWWDDENETVDQMIDYDAANGELIEAETPQEAASIMLDWLHDMANLHGDGEFDDDSIAYFVVTDSEEDENGNNETVNVSVDECY